MLSAVVSRSRRYQLNAIRRDHLDLSKVIQEIDIWKSEDGGCCVPVTGDPGAGPDGRHYVSVLDTRPGLPLDELEF
jgi:hypothetical protein